MKALFSFGVTFLLLFCSLSAWAQFSPNLRYRLVCQSDPYGNLALGSRHQSPALLFHYTGNGQIPSDAWWYIEKGEKGYTLRNAATSEYIVYDSERIETTKKGLALSRTLQGEATEWNLKSFRQRFVIQSVKQPGQWFNLRMDGTHLMGTYEGSGTQNELFDIFDEMGHRIDPEHTSPDPQNHFAEMFESLTFNLKEPVYDRSHQCFYLSLPDSVRQGKPFKARLAYRLKDPFKNYQVFLDDDFKILQDGLLCIPEPECGHNYTLYLMDERGHKVCEGQLQFTYLPIVDIRLDYCSSHSYTNGQIRVLDANTTGLDATLYADFKYRGNTSLRYEKKSFNLKLKDASGASLDHSFFGLRSDNRWILDAMMIDKSCLRNRVSMELWNDFATPPYYADLEPKARTGTRGRFVEVFWNGSYHGLYCMTERIDRKQLDIRKFVPRQYSPQGKDEVHGLLYKAKEWGYEVYMGHDNNNEYLPGRKPAPYYNQLGTERWCNYDIKYPDYESEAVEWRPLYEAVNFVATSSPGQFDRELEKYFDLPVLTDYYLFLDVLLATDNHGKNLYYFAYDHATPEGRKLSLAPWDLDAVLGINWESDDRLTTPDQDLDQYIRTYEHGQHTLFIKLRNSTGIPWKKMLARRYAELRPTHFNPDSLTKRVTTYASLFADSEADHREEKQWGGWHDDLQEGADYITDWIEQRIRTLDEKYGYDPIVASVNEAVAEQYFNVRGGKNVIAVTCGKAQTIRIYNTAGQQVRCETLSEGEHLIRSVAPGVYLVQDRKVIVY